jgi:hypothetical protein
MNGRRAFMSIGIAVAIGVVLTNACTPAPTPSPSATATPVASGVAGVFLPTYDSEVTPGPLDLEGTLTTSRGCIFIEPDDGLRFLALWPAGTRIDATDRVAIELPDGGSAEIGARVLAQGREYQQGDLALVEQLVGPIPAVCRGEEPFWVVTELGAPD